MSPASILGNKPKIRREILLQCANTPDGISVTELEKELNISGLVKNHLRKLENFGLIKQRRVQVRRTAGMGRKKNKHLDAGYRTIRNCPSLAHHCDALDGDPTSERNFLHSPVYRGLVPHVVTRYDAQIPSETILKECITENFPELEMWKCDCNIRLGETEKSFFQKSLEWNWRLFRHTTDFLCIPSEDERARLLVVMGAMQRDPGAAAASPLAAWYSGTGYVVDLIRKLTHITDDELRPVLDTLNIKLRSHPLINWQVAVEALNSLQICGSVADNITPVD